MRLKQVLVAIALLSAVGSHAIAQTLMISLDAAAAGPGDFASEEIRREAAARGMSVLGADAKAPADAVHIKLIVGTPAGTKAAAQSYSIRVRNEGGRRIILVRGADAAGAMYGGLDIAEAIRMGTLDSLKDADQKPHLEKRGIKFNIPLDLRTPSYTDPSDAAQANIPEMWEREFWTDYLDTLARHRYNVLSLWSLHPFPSLVKVPEFPEVALNDVWRTRATLDDNFSFSGVGFVRPEMLANHEVVKRMTMDEKIEFWRWVMQHAADRGIQVYFFTWNVFTFGAEGKHGITMPGSEVLCIRDWRIRLTARQPMTETTPLEIAAALDGAAAETFASLDVLREAAKEDSELRKNITDCEALGWLGRYYAAKIRGACALALFDVNSDQFEHEAALRHLGEAFAHWKRYAAVRDAHYVPALYNRVGYVNVTELTEKVAADIEIARNWKPGSLKDDGRRSGSEKGFRQ
jgi:hypothetical protein